MGETDLVVQPAAHPDALLQQRRGGGIVQLPKGKPSGGVERRGALAAGCHGIGRIISGKAFSPRVRFSLPFGYAGGYGRAEQWLLSAMDEGLPL
jgi:hypothetical protein